MEWEHDDTLFAHMSGGTIPRHFNIEQDLALVAAAARDDAVAAAGGGSDDDEDISEQTPRAESDVPNYYPASIAMSDVRNFGQDQSRRKPLAESVSGESSAYSGSVNTASYSGFGERTKGRHHAGGGDSVFSKGDHLTEESHTSGSAAWHAANLAQMDDTGPQQPAILPFESYASPTIIDQDHWYNTAAAPQVTGELASSATAMASVLSSSSSSAASTGGAAPATTLAAMVPCELAPYTGCSETFPVCKEGAGIDEWADHVAKKHLRYRFPAVAACWFCGKEYAVNPAEYHKEGVAGRAYRRRMHHIARHYRKGETLPAERRRDPGLEEHLRALGLLRDGKEAAQEAGERAAQVPAPVRAPSAYDHRPPPEISTVPVRRLPLRDVQIITERRRPARHGERVGPYRQQVVRD